ncbi:MAG: FAD-binding oxidoreductase [Actinobacteria bacterium]|nr:FAD-binding oxidoreductase [Actinomycetota bacterium]
MSEHDQLTAIVGRDNVSDNPESIEEYAADDTAMAPGPPSCVVRPKDATEVQKIVAWANVSGASLVPVSSGPPHFRGDTVPGLGRAVIVDLRRMSKIVRVDTEHRIAMVEPGVTFLELVPAVRKAGLRLNLPLLPRPTKSVLASMLEREPVIMPKYHWDISDPLACTEVVYGSGDLFKTGSAAGPGTLEEQWEAGAAQNEAAGPIQADFLRLIQGAQGTMGVVTWATIRCEHLPSIEEPYLIGSQNLADLLDFAHWLIRNRWSDDCLLLNDVNLARIMSDDQARDHYELRETLPRWILFYTISGTRYFPDEKVGYLRSDIAELAKSLGVAPLASLADVSANELMEVLHEPTAERHWKTRRGSSSKDIFVISIQDKVEGLIDAVMVLAEEFGYPPRDVGVYLQPMVQGVNYHCEFNVFIEGSSPGAAAHAGADMSAGISTPAGADILADAGAPDSANILAGALFDSASKLLADRGGFFSRPYGPWAEIAYGIDPETVSALQKVKKIFDPNNVMNPGKLCFPTTKGGR